LAGFSSISTIRSTAGCSIPAHRWPTNRAFAELRASHGHPEPYNVKFWSVGNERYDKAYIHRVRDTAKRVKELYPDVMMLCSGSQGGAGTRMPGVHDYLMEQAGEYLDYVSVHNYWLNRADRLPQVDYLTAIMKSEMPNAYMGIVAQSLADHGMDRIKIAFDEWNLRAWQHPGFPRNAVDSFDDPEIVALVEQRRRENDLAEQYTMADALFSASFLNACLRHSEYIVMAAVAPLVNTRGPLFVHPDGIVKRTHFHVMAMYANLLRERVAEVEVKSEKLPHCDASVDVVDAIATVDASGTNWSIALVNRHPSEAATCELRLGDDLLDGTFSATVLTSDSADAFNDIENPGRVAPRQVEQVFRKGTTTLPPHSLMIIDMPRGVGSNDDEREM
jgi:alpha-N-arabinofuranosidase